MCSCHCIWLHQFEFSTVIPGSEKFEKLITLGCLGTLELVPLGCLGALDGWCCREAQSLWCKASGKLREPPIKLWRLSRAICTGSVTAPKGCHKCTGSVTAPKGLQLYRFGDRPQGSLSGVTTPFIVQGREENTVAIVALLGSIVPPHRSNGD